MSINSETKILGIIGNPLTHSLSPIMHNKALEDLGLNYVYVPFPVEKHRLHEVVQALRVLGIAGVNVTIPFKEEIVKYLDDLSDEARACRAVNVVKNRQGRLEGHNTDGPGFMAALKEAGITPGGWKTVVLGAGGAARAIAYQLARAKVRNLTLVNRTLGKAQQLAAFIQCQTGVRTRALGWNGDAVKQAVCEADLLVNTTSIGMFPRGEEMPPLDPEWFKPELVVSDVVYNPVETRLLAVARRRGLRTVDGVGMFIHQGALALEIFTGVKAPVSLMREVVMHRLGEASRL